MRLRWSKPHMATYWEYKGITRFTVSLQQGLVAEILLFVDVFAVDDAVDHNSAFFVDDLDNAV